MSSKIKVNFRWLGRISYQKALELMINLREQAARGEISEQVLFLEHDPVITMGRRSVESDFLKNKEELKKNGIDFQKTDRGGKLTYHGPGQLVVYFILNIKKRKLSVHDLVCQALSAPKEIFKKYQLDTKTDNENPGLWFHDKKLVSVGFHIHKGWTTHGIAINVFGDLSAFSYMIPCGLADKSVSSLDLETGHHVDLFDFSKQLEKLYQDIF